MPSSKLKKRRRKSKSSLGIVNAVNDYIIQKGMEMAVQMLFGVKPVRKTVVVQPETIDVPYEDVTHKRIDK